jgi:hypothetical protein
MRPFLAAIAMTVFVLICEQWTFALAPIVRLMVVVALGSCAYLGALVTIWYLVGRPDTIEKVILSIAMRRLALRS